jgi:hypothetical protein
MLDTNKGILLRTRRTIGIVVRSVDRGGGDQRIVSVESTNGKRIVRRRISEDQSHRGRQRRHEINLDYYGRIVRGETTVTSGETIGR